jgi:dTDP-4-dehydrorhamnose reductase
LRILLTGATGQLGQALVATKPVGIHLITTGRSGGRQDGQLDLADAAACRAAVLQHRPDWVLNAGAYTAVDRAESEPELAWAVNAAAPGALAGALGELGHGRLLQLSTDFVFNGEQGTPYRPEQPPTPLGVYGASKAAGEQAALAALEGGAHVLRTSWVYGPVGRNFCLTMLRLHQQRAAAGEPLAVVADQVGCPTATTGAHGLAAACWRLIARGEEASAAAAAEPLPRILHWSDAGAASWFDFALAIGELGQAAGLLTQAAEVVPITTAQYPTPAQRPGYSLLDCTASRSALGLQPLPWRTALAQVLAELAARG